MNRKEKAMQFANEAYNITVIGRHISITDPMKDYAMEKISKIERFSQKILDVNITMDIQKLEHRVDIVLKVDHLKIKSHANTDNMYASIDEAVDKIVEQLRRYKTKIQDHQARGVKTIDMNVNVVRPYLLDEIESINEEIEEENQRLLFEKYQPHTIVNKKTIPLKVLTYDEAIRHMELSPDDAFLIFRAEEDKSEDFNKLKVIYRRKDKNYGVIEVEE